MLTTKISEVSTLLLHAARPILLPSVAPHRPSLATFTSPGPVLDEPLISPISFSVPRPRLHLPPQRSLHHKPIIPIPPNKPPRERPQISARKPLPFVATVFDTYGAASELSGFEAEYGTSPIAYCPLDILLSSALALKLLFMSCVSGRCCRLI